MMYTMQGIRSAGGGGLHVFPSELSPVNWFCTSRELGPGDRIPLREYRYNVSKGQEEFFGN